ncbi:MAG TPA: ABC transporter substrate-binding protein, partial [Lachnospiraceae bacterium]|nr:ABC transporter substrate-binding protein [Lachnospiraceae bacterium]
IQKAGGKYWDPVKSFGEIIAQGTIDRNDTAAVQASLDSLVEGVTAAIE